MDNSLINDSGGMMKRLAIILVALLLCNTLGVGAAIAQSKFEFKLGFKELADQIPEIVGEPLEDQHHNGENGDALQMTTKGLMVWRKADNWTAFTNGHRSWINGPFGVEERGNEERFKWELPQQPVFIPSNIDTIADSVLADSLLVTWYGNPHTPLMGILGEYEGEELARRLKEQAAAFGPLTNKKVVPAYHLIAVVAMGGPGDDGLWRRRESKEIIDSMLQQARAHGFPLILDVQVGHSRVEDELEYLKPWLEEPDVYLALDPEFDMWPGQVPGEHLGHTVAAEVNYALRFLENIIYTNELPPKVLIVHQFTLSMLPDKERIRWSQVVDLVLDMDGFGNQEIKLGSYSKVMAVPLQYAGIKLFYKYDSDLFSPEQLMKLNPVPSVVIYQ